MECQLHCLSVFGIFDTKHEKQFPETLAGFRSDVQRFDVKVSIVICFQLESLILAQNERWRQA